MIIQNAIRILESDEIIISTSRHDCVTRKIGDNFYMVDGGTEYTRCSYEPDKIEDFALEDDSLDIYEKLVWGTRGKSGRDPVKYLPIHHFDAEHLANLFREYCGESAKTSKFHKEVIEFWCLQKNLKSTFTFQDGSRDKLTCPELENKLGFNDFAFSSDVHISKSSDGVISRCLAKNWKEPVLTPEIFLPKSKTSIGSFSL